MTDAAAPGWYRAPDPEHPGQERYWDGTDWLPSWRPTPAPRKDDPAYAWTLAAVPLIGIVLDFALPRYATAGWMILGFIAVNVLLCVLDERQLKANGWEERPAEVGSLLVPIYLIDRTRKIGSTAGIPIAWFVTFIVSLVVAIAAPSSFDVDSAKLDSQLARQIQNETGTAVSVDCPAPKNRVGGDTIECTVNEPGGVTEQIRVTFKRDSNYTWVLE